MELQNIEGDEKVVLNLDDQCHFKRKKLLDNNSSNNQDYLLDEEKRVNEELKRSLTEWIKNMRFDRAERKSKKHFWFNIEQILSRCRNACVRQWNLSSIWSYYQCRFGERPQNHFTELSGSRIPFTCVHCVELGFDLDRCVKEPSNLHFSVTNMPRDPKFQISYTEINNQHIRIEIVRRTSSFVVSTILCVSLIYNIWSSQLSITQFQSSLLGLFGFMVFVCAVAVMILVHAPFTRMHKAMLIFLVTLLHLQSSNSIREAFGSLVRFSKQVAIK